MKKISKFLIPILIATLFVVGIVYAANTFPGSLNGWDDGDIIESDWADALEVKIGIDGSKATASLDYKTSINIQLQGTASASYGLFSNTLQINGFSSQSYSRFGTNTTTSSFLSGANDLLITGRFEVDGSVSFDGGFKGSGLADCDAAGDTLNWDITSGKFSCGTDSTATASNSLNFDEFQNPLVADTNITFTGGQYAFTFDHASVSSNFEVGGTASMSIGFINNTLTLRGLTANPTGPATGNALLHAFTANGFTRFEQDNEATTNLTITRDNVFIAKNTSGVTLSKGMPVYITGSTGNVPNVAKAKADSSTTMPAVGVVVDEILDTAFGQIMLLGNLSSFDTSAFSTGDQVYVSPTTAGTLTNVRPSGTTNIVQLIGRILVDGVGNGSMQVTTAPFLGNLETGTNSSTYLFAGSASVSTNFEIVGYASASLYQGTAFGGIDCNDAGEGLQWSTATNTFTCRAWADADIPDTITVSGGTLGSNTLSSGITWTTTGTLTIGDNGDVVNFDTSTWDVSSGVFSGVAGMTGTGDWDLGGAELEISNGTGFTFDTVGEIYFDTTDFQIQIASASANSPLVVPTRVKLWSASIASTSNEWFNGGRINLPENRDKYNISEIYCDVEDGTSVVINVSSRAGNYDTETVTCGLGGSNDTSIDTSSNYAGFTKASSSLEIGAITGAVDWLTFSIWGLILPE